VVRNPFYPESISATNVAVTAGISYYFGLKTAAPSTNIAFNLLFEPRPVSLGNISGALLGGNAHWSMRTNVFYSAPDALQVGPLESLQSAYIELVIYGGGTLKFRSKVNSSYGSLTVARRGASPVNFGSHDWTLRTIDLPSSDYNVVRITMSALAYQISGKPSAWLDDIEFDFTSQPRARPSLAVINVAGPQQYIIVPVEVGRRYAIETSTDFTAWSLWTNFLATSSSYPHLRLPPATNTIPHFFRARVSP
jgi:hypothetical protein